MNARNKAVSKGVAKGSSFLSALLLGAILIPGVASAQAIPRPPVLATLDGVAVNRVHPSTGLPLTADGWHDLRALIMTPGLYSDARIIYVSSSSGNDQTAQVYGKASPEIGGDPTNPSGAIRAFATLGAAWERRRNGYPDIILLKRGDVWPVGHAPMYFYPDGRSATERAIISSYGSTGPLPLIEHTGSYFSSMGGPQGVRFTIVSNLRMRDPTNTSGNGGSSAIDWLNRVEHSLIEGLVLSGYKYAGIIQNFDARAQNIVIRRNTMIDNWGVPGNNSGALYISGIDNLLIEENIFDRNGWNGTDQATRSIFDRHIYIQTGTFDPVVRGNFFMRSASEGLQMRSGGVLENNVFIKNPIGVLHAGGRAGGAIRNNLFFDADDRNGDVLGWGIVIQGALGLPIERNVLVSNRSSQGGLPFSLRASEEGISGLRLRNNIVYGWSGPIETQGQASSTAQAGRLHDITVADNQIRDFRSTGPLVNMFADATSQVRFSGNLFSSAAPSDAWFQVADRSYSFSGFRPLVGDSSSAVWSVNVAMPTLDFLASRLAVGSSEDDLFRALRAQNRYNWNPALRAEEFVEATRAAIR